MNESDREVAVVFAKVVVGIYGPIAAVAVAMALSTSSWDPLLAVGVLLAGVTLMFVWGWLLALWLDP